MRSDAWSPALRHVENAADRRLETGAIAPSALRAAPPALKSRPTRSRAPAAASAQPHTGRRCWRRCSAQTAKRINPDHYPAPFALLEHWRRHGGTRADLFASEARQLGRLLSGEAAQNLIRVFFLQERLKALGS